MNDKLKEALRWIGVPVVSIAAMFIVHIVLLFMSGFSNRMVADMPTVWSIETIISDYISCAVQGGAAVYFGALCAPRFNKVVAIVLATICGCLGVFTLIFAGFNLAMILFVVGAIIGATCVESNKED
jgi:hypothetical protein